MAGNLNLDPKTGDYILENGSPQETDSLTIPAYLRLKTQRTRWLYAPNEDYGSDFYLVQKRRTDQDTTFIENIAIAALNPITQDARANRIDVETVAVARHGIGLRTVIYDARGNVEELVLPSIP